MSSYTSISDVQRTRPADADTSAPLFRRYAAWLIGVVVLGLGCAAGVNYAVDPFGRLGRNTTHLHASSERDVKPALFVLRPYEGFIIGSSKTAFIDPLTVDGITLFNASFSAATPEEIVAFIEAFSQTGQTVLVGLDLFMFNEAAFPLVKSPFSRQATVDYLLSLNVLKKSASAIFRTLNGLPVSIMPAGNRNAVQMMEQHRSADGLEYDRVLTKLREEHFRHFVYSTKRVAVLARLRQLEETRGIDVRVFINPLNDDVVQTIKEAGVYKYLERMRRDMKALFPGLVDFSECGMGGRQYYFRHDPYHYLPSVGTDLVRQVLDGNTRCAAG